MDEEILDTSGFYKNENGMLLFGNLVLNANYELRREEHGQHNYPIDGWYWFETEEEAKTFFNL